MKPHYSIERQGWLGLGLGLTVLLGLTGCQVSIKPPSLGAKDADVNKSSAIPETMSHAPIPDPQMAAQARVALATEYFKSGDLDAAKRAASQALESDPKSAEGYQILGLIYQNEGSPINLQRAEENFRKALSLKDSAQIQNNYGVFLSQMQRYREAAEHLEVAGTTLGYENRAGALENLGKTYLQLNEPQKAESAFRNALRTDDHLQDARLELADLLVNRGELAEAARYYQELAQSISSSQQSARLIWLGMKIARLQADTERLEALASRLQLQYSDSDEYRRYQTALQHSGSVWK